MATGLHDPTSGALNPSDPLGRRHPPNLTHPAWPVVSQLCGIVGPSRLVDEIVPVDAVSPLAPRLHASTRQSSTPPSSSGPLMRARTIPACSVRARLPPVTGDRDAVAEDDRTRYLGALAVSSPMTAIPVVNPSPSRTAKSAARPLIAG